MDASPTAAPLARPASPAPFRHLRPIFALGLPLVGFYLIQNAVSVAVVAMLGRFGNTAIAGVGAGGAV